MSTSHTALAPVPVSVRVLAEAGETPPAATESCGCKNLGAATPVPPADAAAPIPAGLHEAGESLEELAAGEYGLVWKTRADGVWEAKGTGGMYYMVPTADGRVHAIWIDYHGVQQDLGKHSLATAAQVAARHGPFGQRSAAAEAGEATSDAWNDSMRRGLGTVGHNRHFTARELAEYVKLSVNQVRSQLQKLTRAGYVGLDDDGYFVTRLGWTWIEGGAQEAGEAYGARAGTKGWDGGRRPSHAEIWANGKPLTIVRKGPRAWTLLVMNHPLVTGPDGAVTFKGRADWVHGLPEHVFTKKSDVESAAFTIGNYMLGLGPFADTYIHHATAGGEEAGEADEAPRPRRPAYTPPVRYTDQQLAYFNIADLVRDLEAARRDWPRPQPSEAAYIAEVERKIATQSAAFRAAYGVDPVAWGRSQGEAGEPAAGEADWDIHIYDPRTQTTRTEHLYVPNTRPNMGDTAAARVFAVRRFHVPEDRILALPHRERSLVRVDEAAAESTLIASYEGAVGPTESGSVCKPWVRMEKDPQAFNACMKLAEKVGPLEGHDRLYEIVRQQMEREDVEVYYAILFDTHLGLRAMSEIARGARDRVPTPMPDLARVALYQAVHYGAMGLAVAHCHPSGKARPSDADRQVTKAVEDGCAAMGLMFVDHLVVGSHQYYSFRKKKIFKV